MGVPNLERAEGAPLDGLGNLAIVPTIAVRLFRRRVSLDGLLSIVRRC